MTLRIAVAGVPGAWSTERLRDALAACGADALVIDAAGCAMDLTEGTVLFEGMDLRRWQRTWRMPFYLQEFVPHAGRDIGAVVLNGRVLGAYYRVAGRGAWMTTTAAGGSYEACEVTAEMARLAVRAADVFGLEFTGVDLVETPGGYLVYEVSAFGGFAGLWRSQGIDAAKAYAEYVVHALRRSAQHARAGVGSPHLSA